MPTPAERDTVLVVGSTTPSPHGQDQLTRLAAQARARGLRLVGADTARALEAGVWRMPADVTLPLEYADPDACRKFAAAHPGVAAVVTVKEGCVLAVAHLARAFEVAGNDPEAVRTVRTKDLCRAVLAEAGFPQPGFAVAAGREEAARFLAATEGPWIVKPRDGMGSAGVSLVRARSELEAVVAQLERPFLVEEFVEGAEYSAEGVMVGGKPRILALTAKRTGAGFVETGHRTPAPLDAVTAAAARDAVAGAVTATGLTHGVLHAEFWVTPAGAIVLGEIHARPGGDFIHALVEETHPGFELYGTLLDDLLGRPVPEPPVSRGAAGADFLVLGPGRVASVTGWEALTTDPALVAAYLSVREGDVLTEVASSADRHGVLVATGPDLAAVDATLSAAKARLDVRLTDVGEAP
ncbi:ATP-grasp domain-containing protein [Streptomyces sp. F001]|uniref:ATP-grasp domain-containing protein n=1 Tax=Streptomyces sp. F001 TaxID=1510026 RepID=UPI00101E67B4|nr:ATP-grasp domain-containing protein [Streptomyces sp. F001]RZB17508.1 ATP-grasp domain-containing protein [Streptomyces sp. F001]